MVYLDCKFTSFFNNKKKNSTFFKKNHHKTSVGINNYELHQLNKWASAFYLTTNYTNFSNLGIRVLY